MQALLIDRNASNRQLLRYCFILLLILFLPATSNAQQPQDDDVVRVNTDLVVVNVTVTDGSGKYARGLRGSDRSEEHTSELQSRQYLVCRLLLEKKNKKKNTQTLVKQ